MTMRNVKFNSNNLKNLFGKAFISNNPLKCNYYHSFVFPHTTIEGLRSHHIYLHQHNNWKATLRLRETKSTNHCISFSTSKPEIDIEDTSIHEGHLLDVHWKSPTVDIRRKRNRIRQKGLNIACYNARKGHKEDAEEIVQIMKFVHIIPSDLAEKAMISMKRALLPKSAADATARDKLQAGLFICNAFLDMNTGLFYSALAKDFELTVFRPMLEALQQHKSAAACIDQADYSDDDIDIPIILQTTKEVIRTFLCRSAPMPQPLTKRQLKVYTKLYTLSSPDNINKTMKYYDDIPQLYSLMSTGTKICLESSGGTISDATDGFLYFYQFKFQTHRKFKSIKFLPADGTVEGMELECDRDCDKVHSHEINTWFRKKLLKDIAWKMT